MSAPHDIRMPRDIIIGSKVLQSLGRLLRRRRFKGPILLLTGENVYKIAGEEALTSLRASRYRVDFEFVGASTMETVANTVEKTKKGRYRTIAALGGGRVISVGNLTAFKRKLPFISMPTAASHDGLASPHASIRNHNTSYSIRCQAPDAIIADVDIIKKAPYRLLAAGCGDLLAKYTAVLDWQMAHRLTGEYYGEYAASLALLAAKHVTSNAATIPNLYDESVRAVMEGLITCGVAMCIAGSSRPCSGSEHLFSHALDMIVQSGPLHGEQCGVGTIMMMYLHGRNWQNVKQTLERIGAPTTAKSLGIDDQQILQALTQAHAVRPDRYTILAKQGLSEKAAERVARETGVLS